MTKIASGAPIRTVIRNLISSMRPHDSCESEHLDFAKAWIDSGAEIFRGDSPDNPDIHLVSYFILVDQQTNAFLLVDHKRAQLWLPPGGHVEINEHPKDTVKREAKEELGIEADFLFEDPFFLTMTHTCGNFAPHTDISLWYVLKGNQEHSLTFDTREFHGICWFQPNDIPFERADLYLRRFLAKFTGMIKSR